MIFTIAEWNEDPNMRAVRSILEHWDLHFADGVGGAEKILRSKSLPTFSPAKTTSPS